MAWQHLTIGKCRGSELYSTHYGKKTFSTRHPPPLSNFFFVSVNSPSPFIWSINQIQQPFILSVPLISEPLFSSCRYHQQSLKNTKESFFCFKSMNIMRSQGTLGYFNKEINSCRLAYGSVSSGREMALSYVFV